MKNEAVGLRVGLIGRAEIIVGAQHTARSMGSGRMEVLATPTLVALMEAAAQNAVDSLLAEGEQTVGTRIDVRHEGATPVGMRVAAVAELTAVDGRNLSFRIIVNDEKEVIGDALHERALASTAVLARLLQRKMRRA